MDKKAEIAYCKIRIKRRKETINMVIDDVATMKNDILEFEARIAELEEPEHRFYSGQPVSVSTDGVCFYHRVLKDFNNGIPVCYTIPYQKGDRKWDIVKPNLGAESIINWIEWNGGECPVDGNQKVIVIVRGGDDDYDFARSYGWNHTGANSDIIRYAIIKQPEWVG